ncbi:tRNA pseudouridine(55) synthase TruB [Gloeothece citriformis]|nr:tRNA pseudouridine(55) synthase TruB [Gloeothece citriformis]
MLGFLNLNKPGGWTSHDCVAKIRRLLKIKRVGHGGTLDPAATGVLPIAVGKATRLLPFLPEKKAYQARIRLGVTTNTDDLQGEILQIGSANHLTLEQIDPLLRQFIGEIEQIPPAFSAISQGGKRLYELARKGELVTPPSRIVHVEKINILDWYPGEHPELELEIICGGGTYIRSIARDLGNLLGVGGTLANLIRTQSCGLELSKSLTLADLETQQHQGNLPLIFPQLALKHLLTISLSAPEARRWCQGQSIVIINSIKLPQSQSVQVVGENGDFLGIGEIATVNISDDREQTLIPKVVLS